MAPPGGDGDAGHGRSYWSQWANWLMGVFVIFANVVGVVAFATTSRLTFLLIAGVFAIVGGGVWLWRLLGSGYSARTLRQLLAFNLVIILLGAGIVGYVLAVQWSGEAQGQTQAASPPPGSPGPVTGATSPPSGSSSPATSEPSTSPVISGSSHPSPQPPPAPGPSVQPGRRPATTGGVAPGVIPATPRITVSPAQPSTNQPFTGTITIDYPKFGEHLLSGKSVGGKVTGWTAGHQVWMSAQEKGSSTELVQGPCQVDGTTFDCSAVRLPGNSDTSKFIYVAVVTDAVAKQLPGASTLPRQGAYDSTEIYKG